MKTFNRICAQGDVLIMRVADLPNREMVEVAPEGNHWNVTVLPCLSVRMTPWKRSWSFTVMLS
jgi:hypothetical protein